MLRAERIGTYFAGYRIDALLGEGGMGEVYRAENPRLGTWLALKILSPALASNEQFRERFVRESRAAASLDHPNVIPIFDADEEDGTPFIAMRFVPGELRKVMEKEGPLDDRRTVGILSQVAEALDWAHAHGVVHRDVKPANILLEDRAGRDHVYLSDFGVAKLALGRGLTSTGEFVGTIEYVAPEQIAGRKVDGRADVYALGCILCECMTGSPPFDRDSTVGLMYAHLEDDPPRLTERRGDLPEEIDRVIRRALAKTPDERHETAAALIADADAALRREALAKPPSIGTVVRTRPSEGSPDPRVEPQTERDRAAEESRIEAVVIETAPPTPARETVIADRAAEARHRPSAGRTVLSRRVATGLRSRRPSRRVLVAAALLTMLFAAAALGAQILLDDSSPAPRENAGGAGPAIHFDPPPVPTNPETTVISCVVPPVRGATLRRAHARIARGDCALGRIGREYSGTIPAGRVIRQNPRPGRHVRRGARVDLIVSRGARPAPPPPPPVVTGSQPVSPPPATNPPPPPPPCPAGRCPGEPPPPPPPKCPANRCPGG